MADGTSSCDKSLRWGGPPGRPSRYTVITFLPRKPANIFNHSLMRRLAAHLALVAIYTSFSAPLVTAHETSLHACCLRIGTHHCQTTNEAGFHSKTNSCPYSTALPASAIVGVEPAGFRVSAPALAGILLQNSSFFYLTAAHRALSDRGPPPLL